MIESLSELFPGVAAMPNVHPLLVHFPIALYYGFLVADICALIAGSSSLRQAATWMLYFGTAGAGAAVFAGFQAADTVEHSEAAHAVMEQHETYGVLVLALGLLLSLIRWMMRARISRLARTVEMVLALTLVAAMTRGADLGGTLVYGYGAAVRSSCECDAEPVSLDPAALPEQQPTTPSPQPEGGSQVSREATPHRHAHPHAHTHRHKN